MNRTHKLKVQTRFWDDLEQGLHTFQLRRNDRAYKVGDTLKLGKYDPDIGFTGDHLIFSVTFILLPEDIPGIKAGWCILGIKPHG